MSGKSFVVELRAQMRRAHRHAHAVGKALTERPGRDFDARRQNILRMARRLRSPLPKFLSSSSERS